MVAYSFKKQFVRPILIGLGAPLSPDEFAGGMDEFGNIARPPGKRQTIRPLGKRRHARPGELISLYFGMRTKQCRKIADARCVSVEGVLLKWSEWPSFCTFALQDGRRAGPLIPIEDMEAFARADGFCDLAQMRKFWADEHGGGTFDGLLIKWGSAHG